MDKKGFSSLVEIASVVSPIRHDRKKRKIQNTRYGLQVGADLVSALSRMGVSPVY